MKYLKYLNTIKGKTVVVTEQGASHFKNNGLDKKLKFLYPCNEHGVKIEEETFELKNQKEESIEEIFELNKQPQNVKKSRKAKK